MFPYQQIDSVELTTNIQDKEWQSNLFYNSKVRFFFYMYRSAYMKSTSADVTEKKNK